ncbi:MAG: hypothetical protein WCI74_11420 [Actinomycetes bacterium]
MKVDLVDDCTFWCANQYPAVFGVISRHTRIVSFEYPGCVVPQTIALTPPPATALAAGTVAVYLRRVGCRLRVFLRGCG